MTYFYGRGDDAYLHTNMRGAEGMTREMCLVEADNNGGVFLELQRYEGGRSSSEFPCALRAGEGGDGWHCEGVGGGTAKKGGGTASGNSGLAITASAL